jgi:serine/threonine protein kinase
MAGIGTGGMGEVYRACDWKLGCDVAIKILPEALSDRAKRLDGLACEAQVLASMNHPNIATVYGLEESDGLFGAWPRARQP